jgi:hypothetical protein
MFSNRAWRWRLLAAVVGLAGVVALILFLKRDDPRENQKPSGPSKAGPSPTQDGATASAAISDQQALWGNPCRFTVQTEVEAIVQAKLDLSGIETTCSFDPKDSSSRGVKYSFDPYKEEVYASLTGRSEPVQGLGEKAAVSNLNPGAHLVIKKGNLLIQVTSGGAGFSDFAFARQSAIGVAEKIFQKL